eukprot:TRINITY_DN32685_c0_g1_i2.p1 TRINITY_DN32685_c0_g1~~TRINITY_DN32685_c0_g1_i2.p1  ORF type:complete len:1052 (+),score=233.59 TRINITY_DN32685_c0_g1_i2:73-3156(+)
MVAPPLQRAVSDAVAGSGSRVPGGNADMQAGDSMQALFIAYTSKDASFGPVKSLDSAGLETKASMDGRAFVKCLKAAGLLTSEFGTTDADLIFAMCRPVRGRRLEYAAFLRALEIVAVRKGMAPDEIRAAVQKSWSSLETFKHTLRLPLGGRASVAGAAAAGAASISEAGVAGSPRSPRESCGAPSRERLGYRDLSELVDRDHVMDDALQRRRKNSKIGAMSRAATITSGTPERCVERLESLSSPVQSQQAQPPAVPQPVVCHASGCPSMPGRQVSLDSEDVPQRKPRSSSVLSGKTADNESAVSSCASSVTALQLDLDLHFCSSGASTGEPPSSRQSPKDVEASPRVHHFTPRGSSKTNGGMSPRSLARFQVQAGGSSSSTASPFSRSAGTPPAMPSLVTPSDLVAQSAARARQRAEEEARLRAAQEAQEEERRKEVGRLRQRAGLKARIQDDYLRGRRRSYETRRLSSKDCMLAEGSGRSCEDMVDGTPQESPTASPAEEPTTDVPSLELRKGSHDSTDFPLARTPGSPSREGQASGRPPQSPDGGEQRLSSRQKLLCSSPGSVRRRTAEIEALNDARQKAAEELKSKMLLSKKRSGSWSLRPELSEGSREASCSTLCDEAAKDMEDVVPSPSVLSRQPSIAGSERLVEVDSHDMGIVDSLACMGALLLDEADASPSAPSLDALQSQASTECSALTPKPGATAEDRLQAETDRKAKVPEDPPASSDALTGGMPGDQSPTTVDGDGTEVASEASLVGRTESADSLKGDRTEGDQADCQAAEEQDDEKTSGLTAAADSEMHAGPAAERVEQEEEESKAGDEERGCLETSQPEAEAAAAGKRSPAPAVPALAFGATLPSFTAPQPSRGQQAVQPGALPSWLAAPRSPRGVSPCHATDALSPRTGAAEVRQPAGTPRGVLPAGTPRGDEQAAAQAQPKTSLAAWANLQIPSCPRKAVASPCKSPADAPADGLASFSAEDSAAGTAPNAVVVTASPAAASTSFPSPAVAGTSPRRLVSSMAKEWLQEDYF